MTQVASDVDEGNVAFTITAAPTVFGPRAVVQQDLARPVGGSRWRSVLLARLIAADAVAALAAAAIGYDARIGFDSAQDARSYLFTSAAIAVAWIMTLSAQGCYEIRRITTGTREYQRVVRAGIVLAGSVAIVCYMADVLVGRTFVAIVIPSGIVFMLLLRLALRRLVYRRRRSGEWSSTILAVGTRESVGHLAEIAHRTPFAGLQVVGACVEDAAEGDEVAAGVPVVGDTSRVAELAERLDVDVVAVAGSGLGPRRIRELGWALEGTRRNMVMAPPLTEVAGPRVHVSPVDGLPLMWVDQPQFSGFPRIVKRAVDIVGSAAILLLASPVLLCIALAVRLTSRGPVIYRSKRFGLAGREFTVLKFRSMYRDADKRLRDLEEHNDCADGLLFKMRRDPRVTPVGRLLRRSSLDELPQLVNVLFGSMSLVGPRPHFPYQVEQYKDDVRRRLLVKPGLTGLWQVSGRSDLSWDESVRLDLYYVENWSLGFDFAIIARTASAVLRRRGAY